MHFPALSLDAFDYDLGVRLTMALLLAVVLLRLIFEDDDLLVFAVLLYLSGNRSAGYDRGSYYQAVFLANQQNTVKLDHVAFASIQLLDVQYVALLDFVLLTTCFGGDWLRRGRLRRGCVPRC